MLEAFVLSAWLCAPAEVTAHAVAAAGTTNAVAADQAWQSLLAASEPPTPPATWQGREPTDQEIADYFRPFEISGADKALDFYTRYPGHPKAVQARQLEFDMLQVAVQRFGDTSQKTRFETLQRERGVDPGEDERFALQMQMLDRNALAKSQQVYRAELEKGARALQKEFPRRQEVYELLWRAYQGRDDQAARSVMEEIATNEFTSPQTRIVVKKALARFGLLNKPVSIQFTALDGRAVDTAGMRGKVILVDFWATWCGPCVADVPNIKAAYEKLHPKGFEIIGISFDSQKENLASFVAKNKMEWPQYFEGAGADNKFGRQFGIVGIPKMWLLDKRGNLRDFDGRQNLEEKVAKLLTEQ